MATEIITSTDAFHLALNCDWDIDWQGQGVVGVQGISQVIYNGLPRFYGAPRIHVQGEAIRRLRAVRAYAQGRVKAWRVPLVDKDGFGCGVAWNGGVPWDGGALWAGWPSVGCSGGAAAGAEQVVVQEGSHQVAIGQFISWNDWPYVVTSRYKPGPSTVIGVQPPLRVAIPSGATLSLRAFGLFKMTSDTTGNPAYGGGRRATPVFEFEEWLGSERFA